jgi:hypothetical protein
MMMTINTDLNLTNNFPVMQEAEQQTNIKSDFGGVILVITYR